MAVVDGDEDPEWRPEMGRPSLTRWCSGAPMRDESHPTRPCVPGLRALSWKMRRTCEPARDAIVARRGPRWTGQPVVAALVAVVVLPCPDAQP